MKRTGPPYSRKRDKALKALIKRAGSLSEIGRKVRVTRKAVSQWTTVPDRHKKTLEAAFGSSE